MFFEFYISNSKNKIKTVKRFQYTLNVLRKYKSNLLVTDITVDFLNEFERKDEEKITPATISGKFTRPKDVLLISLNT